MKVALLFWGIARSLKYTLPSIQKNVFDILKQHNIQYDTYFHTYHIDGKYTNRRANEIDVNIDNEQYKLLPNANVKIDNQNAIAKKINLPKYRTKGDPWKTNFQTLNFFILGSYSKLQCWELCKSKKIHYDCYIYLRPDVQYLNPLNIDWIRKINNSSIYVPAFHHTCYKFNDRFAICKAPIANTYGSIFKTLLKYSVKIPLHSETVNRLLLTSVHKNINITFIPFYFNRVRANGYIKPDCNNIKP